MRHGACVGRCDGGLRDYRERQDRASAHRGHHDRTRHADAVENVGLIIDINNIAAKYGMSIKNTRINGASSDKSNSTGPNSNKYGSITMSFVVSTTYENFLAFLSDLEASLRLVDVTSLSFSSAQQGRYDYNITLQTYWLK